MKPDHALFAVVDGGIATLPDEVTAARDALRRLDEAKRSLRQPAGPGAIRPSLVAALARSGDMAGLDDAVAQLAAAEQERATWEWRRGLVMDARDQAVGALSAIVEDCATEIITDHLAPALAVVVAAGREAVAKFAPHGTSDAALVGAPKAARDAWLAFRDVVSRYYAIRRARDSLLYRYQGKDPNAWFAEIRNPEEAWPAFLVGDLRLRPTRPWSDPDPVQYLINLLGTPRAELWCPTGEQQDARWTEVFGEAEERMRRSWQSMNGTRARFEDYVPKRYRVVSEAEKAPAEKTPSKWRRGPGHVAKAEREGAAKAT